MRRFVFLPEDPDHRFALQARDIQEKLAASGYELSLQDVISAWESYSDSVCATWIDASGLDGEEIFRDIRHCLQEVDVSPGPGL